MLASTHTHPHTRRAKRAWRSVHKRTQVTVTQSLQFIFHILAFARGWRLATLAAHKVLCSSEEAAAERVSESPHRFERRGSHQPTGTTCTQLPLFLTPGTDARIHACVRRHTVAGTLFLCWRKLRLIRSQWRPHSSQRCRHSALLHAAYRKKKKKKDWNPGRGGWEQMTEWNASLSHSYGFCFLRHLMDSELPLRAYRLAAAGCFTYSFRCCFNSAALNSNHLINYSRQWGCVFFFLLFLFLACVDDTEPEGFLSEM